MNEGLAQLGKDPSSSLCKNAAPSIWHFIY